jgi:Flp pilus assembly secretin CpaC
MQPNGTLLGVQKFAGTQNSAAQITGILNATNARAALRALEARSGIEILGEPEVTTTSGRQTQMRVTAIVTVVTNMVFQETFTNQDGTVGTNAIVPQTSKVEIGPTLDVVPYVLADGYTINLALIPSVTEFLGYDKSTSTTAAHNRAGEKIDVPQVLPRFTVRQVATTLNLWDNQTAIISGLPETTYVNGSAVTGKPKTGDKELLVFITATIIDPAGNRVHTDAELPFAQKGIPPQPTPPAQPK